MGWWLRPVPRPLSEAETGVGRGGSAPRKCRRQRERWRGAHRAAPSSAGHAAVRVRARVQKALEGLRAGLPHARPSVPAEAGSAAPCSLGGAWEWPPRERRPTLASPGASLAQPQMLLPVSGQHPKIIYPWAAHGVPGGVTSRLGPPAWGLASVCNMVTGFLPARSRAGTRRGAASRGEGGVRACGTPRVELPGAPE